MTAAKRVIFFLFGKREVAVGVKDSGASTNSVSDAICPCDDCCCGRISKGCVLKPSNGGVCVIAQVPPTLVIRSSLAVGRAIVSQILNPREGDELASALHRTSVSSLGETALASRRDASGASDTSPVLLQHAGGGASRPRVFYLSMDFLLRTWPLSWKGTL